MQNKKSYTVLGIDPGYERMGVAIIEKSGGKEKLIFSNCVITKTSDPHPERLYKISFAIKELIKKYKPSALAIEKLFFNVNQKTAMKVAESRGVVLSQAAGEGVTVFEYTPLEVKTATVGFGRAEKRQVKEMVSMLISIPKKKMLDDEYDAIAVGLTCLAREKFAPK